MRKTESSRYVGGLTGFDAPGSNADEVSGATDVGGTRRTALIATGGASVKGVPGANPVRPGCCAIQQSSVTVRADPQSSAIAGQQACCGACTSALPVRQVADDTSPSVSARTPATNRARLATGRCI